MLDELRQTQFTLALGKPMIFGRRDIHARLDALGRSQAVIEFKLDGTILTANANFLNAVGYRLDEIRGQHHRMFLNPAERDGEAYKAFWTALSRGEFQSGEYKRIGKRGKEIWIQATYNPILDRAGKPLKVVKFCTDITEQKMRSSDHQGKVEAIDRSQAVIEFTLDGMILDANRNFLTTVGYDFDEIRGQHHRLFVDRDEREGSAYKAFWAALGRGEFQSAEYKRIGKGGREIWIQATYNPILDPSGRPVKVVKFCTDITEQKLLSADHQGKLQAIDKSQGMIEFNLDGTVITANANFLNAVGYRLDEIIGQHHRMFVDPSEREGTAYKAFWTGLGRGEFQSAEYRRIGKGLREIWIQATYNPIFDPTGKPVKVVKFCTDITPRKSAQMRATAASSQTLLNVQAVASASEEMTASIREISESLSRSRAAVDEIHEQAQAADASTCKLRTAATSMNGLVQLIQGVGQQINLLALNATIEAARAGEAGRGFAVVASEVKSLSDQVTTATGRISSDIEAMQGISGEVVASLEVIGKSITSVRGYVTGVASAVEEQSAVTQEISAGMQTAARGVADVAQSLHALTA